MPRPKFTKPDLNQSQIVKDLRSLGFDVDVVSNLPGLYDLVVSGQKYPTQIVDGKGFYRCTCSVRVEVKSKNGLMTDGEINYYELQRHKESYIVAYSAEDVLKWFNYSA